MLGVVGESGTGKSLTGTAIIGLLAHPAGRIAGGQILFDGTRSIRCPRRRSPAARAAHRRNLPGPADHTQSAAADRPAMTETIHTHLGLSAAAARDRAVHWLDEVGIRRFPRASAHRIEFSGGQRSSRW